MHSWTAQVNSITQSVGFLLTSLLRAYYLLLGIGGSYRGWGWWLSSIRWACFWLISGIILLFLSSVTRQSGLGVVEPLPALGHKKGKRAYLFDSLTGGRVKYWLWCHKFMSWLRRDEILCWLQFIQSFTGGKIAQISPLIEVDLWLKRLKGWV